MWMHILTISSFAIIKEISPVETFFCHMEEMGSKLHFRSYERKLELVEIGIQWSENFFMEKKTKGRNILCFSYNSFENLCKKLVIGGLYNED